MSSSRFHLLHYLGFDLEVYVQRGLDRATRFAQVNVMMGTSGQYLRKTDADFRAHFSHHQTSDQLRVVPFTPVRPDPSGKRKLLVGSRKAPMAGWDTLDWGEGDAPTHRADLRAPDWPIAHDLYDEVVVAGGLGEASVYERQLILRRLWRIMSVGSSLRLLQADQRGGAWTFGDMRSDLFRAGFMDVRDLSLVYSDWSASPSLVVGAFKQAAGGRFGWLAR
jgi:hypothetical protein